MYSTAEFLNDYGTVILVDLPGIGGMDSFYDIKRKPTLDAYADYLYSVLPSIKSARPIKVVAMSFGFLVLTRMLQKYPDSEAWFSDVISFVGFGRAQDFKNLARKQRYYIPLSRMLSTQIGGWLVDQLIFNPLSLRIMFAIFRTFNPKYQSGQVADRRASVAMELDLWQRNDARTRFALYEMLFTFDLTRSSDRLISVPLHDMTTPSDQYFAPKRVAKTLKQLYARVSASVANIPLHAPSIMGDKAEITGVFSTEAKAILTNTGSSS